MLCTRVYRSPHLNDEDEAGRNLFFLGDDVQAALGHGPGFGSFFYRKAYRLQPGRVSGFTASAVAAGDGHLASSLMLCRNRPMLSWERIVFDQTTGVPATLALRLWTRLREGLRIHLNNDNQHGALVALLLRLTLLGMPTGLHPLWRSSRRLYRTSWFLCKLREMMQVRTHYSSDGTPPSLTGCRDQVHY